MSFFTQLTDRAQNAISQSPLAAHLPAAWGAGDQPSANQAAAQGGHRSHALESLHHQIRSIGQQYTNATPVQRIITTEKGVALDFDSLARDAKVQSKELYTWGNDEDNDLKDVTDRLAYVNYVHGELAESLAKKLDTARQPLKALRGAEAALAPKRNARAALEARIGRLEHSQDRNTERLLPELRKQLAHAEHSDEPHEKEVLILKRKGVRDSERAKWVAIREYAEKLVLLSQAVTPIIDALPLVPPTSDHPYTGTERTAAARAALQKAFDHYTPGQMVLPPLATDLSRSDTRSFGESHASELSSIVSTPIGEQARPSIPVTPPPGEAPHQGEKGGATPPPIDPSTLNFSPAPIPARRPSPDPVPIPLAAQLASEEVHKSPPPDVTPTVAETGVPLSAGPSGPGPASGSLRDMRAQARAGSADELYVQPVDESAKAEKKRLEREEQERVRAARAALDGQKDEELPPYQYVEE